MRRNLTLAITAGLCAYTSQQYQMNQLIFKFDSKSLLKRIKQAKKHEQFIVVTHKHFSEQTSKNKFEQQVQVLAENLRKDKITLLSHEKEASNAQLQELLPSDSKKDIEMYYKNPAFPRLFRIMNLAELFEEIGVIKSSKPETDYAKLVQSVCKILTDDVFPKSTLVIKQCRTEQCRSKFISDIQNVVQGKNLQKDIPHYRFFLIDTNSAGKTRAQLQALFKNQGKVLTGEEQMYLVRRDIIGKSVSRYSEWLELKDQSQQNRFLCFIKPRVQIVSSLRDMIFLIKSSKLNEQPILIINNTPSFLNMANKVSPQVTIDTIRKIYASHPELNLGIVNTRSANIGFKIIDSYCKYAILKQKNNSVDFHSQCLQIDDLEQVQGIRTKGGDMNTKFTINYDQEINKFLASNKHAYPLLAYKETEINLPKVAELSSLNQPRILRICRSRCRQYLPDRLVAEVREQNSDIPQEVYWIDSSTHNIGVVQDDYILNGSTLTPINDYLQGLSEDKQFSVTH